MSDIQPGDVVVCVDDAPKPEWAEYFMDDHYVLVVAGQLYRVDEVEYCPIENSYGLNVGVPNIDGNMFWDALRFRKIDAADEQFTALIRKRKPVEA